MESYRCTGSVAVDQSLSCVQLFVTPLDCSMHQAPLSLTISWSLLRLMSIESLMPSNHPLLPPSSFAINLSQLQSLFQWVSSLHHEAKILEPKYWVWEGFIFWSSFVDSAWLFWDSSILLYIFNSFVFSYFWTIFHCVDTLDMPWFIYSSLDGHLCCFQFLTITNKDVMSIYTQVSVWSYAFISLG